MKIFFTCATESIAKHAVRYRAIRDGILALGHKINRDWINYSINIAKRDTPDVPTDSVYQDIMAAIHTADAIVIEATVESTSVGHQLAHALQNNKPVLLLRYGKKGKGGIKKLLVEGSDSKNLTVAAYQTKDEIPKILKRFFSKYEDRPKKRFNLVLTGAQENYINWASFFYKKNKTEVIHYAIEKSIERDSSYKKYLLNNRS